MVAPGVFQSIEGSVGDALRFDLSDRAMCAMTIYRWNLCLLQFSSGLISSKRGIFYLLKFLGVFRRQKPNESGLFMEVHTILHVEVFFKRLALIC